MQEMRTEVSALRADLSGTLRHVAVVRYDAFGDMGGRLSFSAALLDDDGDGLVLTSINSRTETRTYAKGVQGGASSSELSPEEQEAIDEAVRPRRPAGARRRRGALVPGVPPARFGYLGPAGTFTEAALRTRASGRAGRPRAVRLGGLALDAVRAGEVDGAMVPLENSVEGSVATTLDELASGDPLQITREVLLPVRFALLGRPGTLPSDVRTVATHPHAEAQCRRWLRDVLPEAASCCAPRPPTPPARSPPGAYDAAISAPDRGAGVRPAGARAWTADSQAKTGR
jgi:hypothetical protein